MTKATLFDFSMLHVNMKQQILLQIVQTAPFAPSSETNQQAHQKSLTLEKAEGGELKNKNPIKFHFKRNCQTAEQSNYKRPDRFVFKQG